MRMGAYSVLFFLAPHSSFFSPLHLLCLDHVEVEVVVPAPHGQVSDLLPIGCLVVVVIRPTTVVSSANVMMVLESCLAVQS
jgi:hypothetical protein